MKIILTEDVKKIGKKGEVVNVKQGYFRNYILPNNLGVEANKENLAKLDEHLKQLKKEEDENIKAAMENKEKIEKTEVIIKVKAGENGKLFGSITNMDIKKALDEKNIEVDKKKIDKADIDSLGDYEVTIKLYQQVSAKLKVKVEAIIGCIITKSETIDQAIQLVKPYEFYDSRCQRIYKTLVNMYQKDIKIDEVSLISKLKSENILEEVGGEQFIVEITLSSFYTPNMDQYCENVKEKALLRALIGACDEIVGKSYEQKKDAKEVIEMAESKIFEISQKNLEKGLVRVSETMDETIKQLELLSLNEGKITGVTTGISSVDDKLSGLQNSQLILLAARPAMGKTALGLTMACNAANAGKSVAFFSLEMSTYQLNQRLISMVSMIDLEKIITGNLEADEWIEIINAITKIKEKEIYVDETAGITLSELRSKCKRLKAEEGLDLIVIDYLQLMTGEGRFDNRQQEIAQISRGLKSLSKEINCPVLSLAQLSREADKRSDHKPILSDLRESGAIEQDADVVMLLYREDYYDVDDNPNVAKVILAKHRNGPTGLMELFFHKQCTTFKDLSHDEK